jgi:thiol-disulfide isomerase/thioredoxin
MLALVFWLAAPLIGDVAPALALQTLDGKAFAGLTGQITVVEFFATWCAPCREGLADLAEVRKEVAGVNLVIVAVDRAPAVRAYFADHPQDAVVVLDTKGDTAKRWGETRLPTSFFVDRTSIIRHINRGHGPGYRARATRWLRSMVPPSPLHEVERSRP